MTVLVTGASGAFGAHYAKKCLDEGMEVVSIRHDEAPYDTASLLGIRERIIWARGSITDERLCKRVVADYGVDAIFNFAALPLVQVATRTTTPIFETNFLGVVNLLEAVKENAWAGKKIRFIQVSTDKVYGDAGPRPYTEDMPLNGLAIYDASKAAADLVARTYATCGFAPAVAVVRACNIIAPGDMNLGRVLPRLIVPSIRGEDPILYKTTYQREFIAVEDAVDGIFAVDRALQMRATVHGQAFNIGSGQQRTMEQAVNEVLNYFPGRQVQWIKTPDISRVEIPFQKLDTSKVREFTGWRASRTFEGTVSNLVGWWRDNWDALPEQVKRWRATSWHG